MNRTLKTEAVGKESGRSGAEKRLKELGIQLSAPPEPFGTYVEAVQTGNLLFLSGMLPTEGHTAKFTRRVGAELDVQAGRDAARLAALNVLAVARHHLGSLDRVTRIVRLGVSVATVGDVRDQPKVADGASELFQNVFGKERNPCRLVYMASQAFRSVRRSNLKSSSRWRKRYGTPLSTCLADSHCFSITVIGLSGGFVATTAIAIGTMKVAQVSNPGADFQIVEREIPEPGLEQVHIRVQAHFTELTGVRPKIETYPLEKADEAYARMMSGKAQFRVVLTM